MPFFNPVALLVGEAASAPFEQIAKVANIPDRTMLRKISHVLTASDVSVEAFQSRRGTDFGQPFSARTKVKPL